MSAFELNTNAVYNAARTGEEEGEDGGCGAAIASIEAQIRAHDPSLPGTLKEQLRELLARPTEDELRRVLVTRFVALMPKVETLLASIEASLGRPLTNADAPLIIVTMDEIRRATVAAMAPSDPQSFGIPDPPPPPPPPGIAMDPPTDGAES